MPEIVTLTINPAIDIFVNVDRVEPTHKLRCSPPKRDPGGGGINVARVAHRLGADVMAIYPIGGQIGKLLHRLVEREDIASLVTPSHVETRENFTAYEEETGEQYRFVLPGSRLHRAEWEAVLDRLASLTGAAEIRGRERQRAARRAGRFFRARSAAGQGARRQDRDRYVAALRSRRRSPKASRSSSRTSSNLRSTLARPLERDHDRIAACRQLAADGRAEIVALTLGDQGALLVTAERAWRALPLKIEAVSTVGAGDSFLGGLVAALAAGKPLEDAFRVAVAAASAAVMHAGDRPVPTGRREPAIAGREDQGDRARAGVTHASPRQPARLFARLASRSGADALIALRDPEHSVLRGLKRAQPDDHRPIH